MRSSAAADAAGAAGAAGDLVEVDGRPIAVWPEGLRAAEIDDKVFLLENDDLVPHHAPLVDAILAEEARLRVSEPLESLGCGGMKVRDLPRFGLAVFSLIQARLLYLFRRVTGAAEAHVDDCWANVFRDGEYAMPHRHNRAFASAVYDLRPGDAAALAADPLNGFLTFADPRMASCCRDKKHYVSTPAFMPRGAGRLALFPGQYTHLVTPYRGQEPRISIAWNLNPRQLTGAPRHDGRVE